MTRFDRGHRIPRADWEAGVRVSRLVGGSLLLFVGGLLVLQNFGVLRAGRVWDFWPLLLVWIGLTRVLGPRRSRHFVSGGVLLALGVFFQLERLGWIGASIEELWPIFLVVAGMALILEGLRAKKEESSPVSPGAAEPGDPS